MTINSEGKLLILSFYYHGDLLVQINSFSWRGFQGSCEAAVLATGSCTLGKFHSNVNSKFGYLALQDPVVCCMQNKNYIPSRLVKSYGPSILISILFLKNSYGEMQLNEYNVLNKVKRNVFFSPSHEQST